MAHQHGVSIVRQNYHQDCEVGVNKQINLELYASYVYLSMVSLLSLLVGYSNIMFSTQHPGQWVILRNLAHCLGILNSLWILLDAWQNSSAAVCS